MTLGAIRCVRWAGIAKRSMNRAEAVDPQGWYGGFGRLFCAECHARLGNERAALEDCAALRDDHWTPGLLGAPAGSKQEVAYELRRRDARHASRGSLSSAASPGRRRRAERIFGPGVLGIAAAHLAAHLRIAVRPELARSLVTCSGRPAGDRSWSSGTWPCRRSPASPSLPNISCSCTARVGVALA